MLPTSLLKSSVFNLEFGDMKTRSDRADPRAHLAEWEYLVEPLEHELRQLRGVGFTIAAQTAMYHQRNSLGHERLLHQRILLEGRVMLIKMRSLVYENVMDVIVVYGFVCGRERWLNHIEDAVDVNVPTIVMGDFNLIHQDSKKRDNGATYL